MGSSYSAPSAPAPLPRDLGPYVPSTNKVQYEMWRFIHDFDFGYDMTFEQRFARENCNDRGEVLNWNFANLVKYEMVYYFALCHQELQASGKLSESVGEEEMNKEADQSATEQIDLTRKEFRLVESPFPAPPLIGRIWDLWILYSREYRQFCMKFYGGILIKNVDSSKESFEAYQKVRAKAQVQLCENVWPEYETYDDFLFEMQSPVIWISMKQKNEFLRYVTSQYAEMKEADPSRSITDMSTEICKKYMEILDQQSKAKDAEIEEVDGELKLRELGDQLPETAKPELKNFIQKKVNQMNAMQIPQSVYEHLEAKHMMTPKQSKRYVAEYKKYLTCAMASKIAVTPSEQTDLVWHTHLCTNSVYPIQMAKVMFKKRLGRFDHGPTKGGNAQGILFTEQYTRTLEIYRYLFGNAPDDIWEPLERRFEPTLFCLFHVDLRRLCNYRIAVEMTRERSQMPEAVEPIDKEQADSIVKLGLPSDPENRFFYHQGNIQRAYVDDRLYFGGSFAYGGKCYVQKMYQSEYYSQPHFFQYIEDNTKLGEIHPSIKSKDTNAAKKLTERITAEVEEVDRRYRESEMFERRYSARYPPARGAACFSYSHFYRKLDQKMV